MGRDTALERRIDARRDTYGRMMINAWFDEPEGDWIWCEVAVERFSILKKGPQWLVIVSGVGGSDGGPQVMMKWKDNLVDAFAWMLHCSTAKTLPWEPDKLRRNQK